MSYTGHIMFVLHQWGSKSCMVYTTTLSVLFLHQLLYCHLNLYPLPCSLFLVPVIWPVACHSPAHQSCPVWTVWVHFKPNAYSLVCVFAQICRSHLPTEISHRTEFLFCTHPPAPAGYTVTSYANLQHFTEMLSTTHRPLHHTYSRVWSQN